MTRNELDRENVSALTAAEMRQLDSLVFWGMRWETAMAAGRKSRAALDTTYGQPIGTLDTVTGRYSF